MRVKKYNGRVYGAELNAAERKAMDMEITRQIIERDALYKEDIDAMVLYVLMSHYGWKKKRLHKFWKAFMTEHKALVSSYQIESNDNRYVAHWKLKQIGVDIHQWYKEDKQSD